MSNNIYDFEWPADWPQPTKGANCSPLLSTEGYEATKRDIQKNGLYDKIHFTPEGKISKGRSRYRALRELGKSHDEIVRDYAVTVKSSLNSDVLSNILRVHRSKPALIASYLLANPKSIERLLADREKGSKSGEAKKVAAIVGCAPMTISRFLDQLTEVMARNNRPNNPISVAEALDLLTLDVGSDLVLGPNPLVEEEGESISNVTLAPPRSREDRPARARDTRERASDQESCRRRRVEESNR